MKESFEWDQNKQFSHEKGVIVGCTKEQEWLLPWWWMNFRLHNQEEVTFFNLGTMSDEAISWCQSHGKFLTLPILDHLFKGQGEIATNTLKEWEKAWWSGPDLWNLRPIWLKKPLAMISTPYKKTVWLDLDCQVRGSIQPLFEEYLTTGFAIAPENEANQRSLRQKGVLLPDETMYNSGVIAFSYGSTIIQEWVKSILEQNHLFLGDQQLLTRMLHTHKPLINTLPLIYNWAPVYGNNHEAVILHWWGPLKEHLAKFIDLLEDQCFIPLSIKNKLDSGSSFL